MTSLALIVTPKQAAALLGISVATCYRALGDGQIPSRRLRGRILIARSAIEKILDDAGHFSEVIP